MSKLVESNMINKLMGPKPLYRDYHSLIVNLIRLPNLQICYNGKTNTYSHISGQEL